MNIYLLIAELPPNSEIYLDDYGSSLPALVPLEEPESINGLTMSSRYYGPPRLPPVMPSTSYGIPAMPTTVYGAPQPSYGPPSTLAPIIHKHVYFFRAAPEPEYNTPKATQAPIAPQKHYRILFIKAPAPPIPTVRSLTCYFQNSG